MRFKVSYRFTSTAESVAAMAYLVSNGYGFDVTVRPSAIVLAADLKGMKELVVKGLIKE